MLPVKSIDAALPFWGFTTLAILLGALASGQAELRAWTLALLGTKWLLDAALFAAMLRWHRRTFPLQAGRLGFAWQLFCGCTESLGFNWLRQVAVLRAYGWCFRRIRPWKQARWREWPSGLPPANDSDPAPQAQTGS